ncbi:hypothetical protein K2173_007940 [Erythroxylum novogranatense]|uniref:Growth-regulating factor n=1 Tax=Erythroxylum novogranatense TaxID=1862640 RepID=A0AAV8T6U5_9ROSI|nr:hypothetical protein K2173_007940 [Erythroxylum novogranatense]
MDFGVVGLDGLVGSDTSTGGVATLTRSDPDTKLKWHGSGFLKQDRSDTTEDDWRRSKQAKTESMLHLQRNMSLKSNTTLFADGQRPEQMISFSCSKSETEKTSQHVAFPYFHITSAYGRNTGYNSGSFSSVGSMHGAFSDAKGPFTQSQWMELERQALIYKYLTSNVPVPSHLLTPIRKAVDSAGFNSFPGGFLRPSTLQWGSFQLGFSSNTDPEPGRCRRTDGKKWRCSREAVADQKYCERHMNRGRHRSRKPVEVQTGHSNATTTSTTTASSAKSIVTASPPSAVVVGHRSSSGGTTNSVTIAQQQLQTISSSNLVSANPVGRKCITEEFGLGIFDSLNPQHKSSFLMNGRNYGASQNLSDQETASQRSLRQFMNDWPKNQCDRSIGSWPELDIQSDRTQLSISIPMSSSDYMFSTSSSNSEKTTLSGLRSSCELDPIQMGLGVGTVLNEPNQRQASWIPIAWETSMGGPLGEVLHTTNNGSAECRSSSALNLMVEGWDSSPRLNSSPTGVLQKATFGSLSNSSIGHSPGADNRNSDGTSLCDELDKAQVHLPVL